ncbi:Na(+)-linked D-alanine and glycine permease [Catenovulum agarivorans DS-2]|uniref:Na(+)-linked D-alanine and glycine permease n=1 Tax=Catenovulum agarivorans DS-2 TaxID=1328313 RepID=W7R3I1_9ALTE|nr:amino acid carrier protein [Catenovulum agarivorans]EWH12180.1 Na(+)-linked D-alanine and glycine permease [Catenovulum agarivorans DS-2]
MESLNQFLLLLDSLLGSAAYFPYVLLCVGAFFTIYLKFPQLRYFRSSWQCLFRRSQENTPGDTSHFQALTTALSGTVGTGNIGGVGLAIYLGGPAALFWMWMTAFVGMATKYVEVTLSHKYRVQTADGSFAGGPMYYMDRKLNMRWLAIIFAIAAVVSAFGIGAMPQINNIAQAMQATFALQPAVTGGVLAILLALVIIGGIQRIAKVTAKIVPFMAALYIIGGLAVATYQADNILPSLQAIVSGVFTGSAAVGGFLGASFAFAFSRGVNRGLFSNEAGAGSSPIAHASAKTTQPVDEGKVALLEPFIDTIILCTITGLVILSSNVWHQKHQNKFAYSDTYVLSQKYVENDAKDKQQLFAWLNQQNSEVELYSGKLQVENGVLVNDSVTLIHARSIAEAVTFSNPSGQLYSGEIEVKAGKITPNHVDINGLSLIHSTALTAKAFNQGWFGDWGQYIVTFSILLFAFSTSISWSYYGDRAMVYLFGNGSVIYFRISYILGFFVAAIADTTLIWNLAAVAVAFMTLPNLFAILLLHKDIKQTQQKSEQKVN